MAVPDPYKAARATSLGAKATSLPVPTASPVTVPAPNPTPTKTTATKLPVPKAGPAVPAPPTTPTPTSSIDSAQFADWKAKTAANYANFEKLSQSQFSYDPETDPGYQAQRQLATLRAGDATKSAMEAANEKGIFGSSVMTSQLGQIQQRAEQEAAAYIPEYRNQAYSQYQDRLTAAGNLLNASAGRQDADRSYGLSVADRTGYITPDGSNELKSQLLALKGQAEAPGITAAQRSVLSRQADAIRAQLQGMGVDISGLGANVNQANAASVNLGTRTLAGQSQDYGQAADTRDYSRGVLESDRNYGETVRQSDRAFEYTAGRDKVQDEQWMKQFDEQVKQNGIGNALAWAQNKISQQNANTSAYSASTSRMNANDSRSGQSFNQKMDIWKATGLAPEGISGVVAGTPYSSSSASAASNKIDYSSDPSFAQDITWINQNHSNALEEIQSQAQALIGQYGYNGYQELLKAAGG